MINILKKELGFYFKGMSGYFFGAVTLMFAGIYTVILNCKMGYANYEYTVNNMSFMYLILVPVITMRSVAEERRQKTDKLLYSLPVTMLDVALGKYLAMLTVLLIPVIVLSFYPMALLSYGEVSYKMALLNIVALYILGAAMISIGLFVSTLTENQAIAAGLSFAVFLITYFGKTLANYVPGTAFASLIAIIVIEALIAFVLFLFTANVYLAGTVMCVMVCVTELLYMNFRKMFEGLFVSMVDNISVFERFYVFARGVFDLRSIAYFISIIIFFLYLSVMSLEKRRWS